MNDIKYWIENEDKIDWEKISGDSENSLSLLELKLFKHKIDWEVYIKTHFNEINDEIIELAKNNISKDTINRLIAFNKISDNFVIEEPEKIDFEVLLKYSNVSEDTLIATQKYWENLPNLKEILEQSYVIKLTDPSYARVKLVYEVL